MKIIPAKIIENCYECNDINCNKPWRNGFLSDCPLEDYKPEQWLDKPDSIGNWWFYGDLWALGKTKSHFVTIDDSDLHRLYYPRGKWQKATIPEPQEEKI